MKLWHAKSDLVKTVQRHYTRSFLIRQLPLANLHKILGIKFFRATHQIHKGDASIFVKPFSSRL